MKKRMGPMKIHNYLEVKQKTESNEFKKQFVMKYGWFIPALHERYI
jgi:hypothetical protein